MAPQEAEVVAGQARLAVPLDLAVLALPEVVADPAVPVHLAVLAVPAQREVAAELVVEEALHRSFSSAMVGSSTSAGTPRYSPVPRSGRKANCRP